MNTSSVSVTTVVEPPQSLSVAVRCLGLRVNPKASFQHVGVLNSLYLRYTNQGQPKNEKRYIKVSQSEPFKPTGRPPK